LPRVADVGIPGRTVEIHADCKFGFAGAARRIIGQRIATRRRAGMEIAAGISVLAVEIKNARPSIAARSLPEEGAPPETKPG
jgi:hypothetical protein